MKLYLLLFVNFFLLISCKKYKQAEAAFFIRSTETSVKTVNTPLIHQGSGSSKITDFYLYVDGKFQGAYPVGNLMPIINKNQGVTINLFAGIKNNGISSTRIPYPFYDYLTLDTLVEGGKTIQHSFAFKYGSGVNFDWTEDFEPRNTGSTMMASANSDITFKFASSSDSYEGRSLELSLTGDSSFAQIESIISYPLPAGTANVYLELNYKCNAPITVGVIGDAAPKDAFVITPQANWNKIYISLSGVVSLQPVSSTYKVFFKTVKTTDYPNPRVFLDNIKLLHL